MSLEHRAALKHGIGAVTRQIAVRRSIECGGHFSGKVPPLQVVAKLGEHAVIALAAACHEGIHCGRRNLERQGLG